MSDFGDDIEFDFFDEPKPREDEPRRRPAKRLGGAGGPPRRAVRPPRGFTPLLRLAGLIAFAILIVVVLVFWVQSCQGASKQSAYQNYMAQVSTIAQDSEQTGKELNNLLATPGLKEADLESKLASFAQLGMRPQRSNPPFSPSRELTTASTSCVGAML